MPKVCRRLVARTDTRSIARALVLMFMVAGLVHAQTRVEFHFLVGSKYSNDNQISKFGGPRGPVESALPVG